MSWGSGYLDIPQFHKIPSARRCVVNATRSYELSLHTNLSLLLDLSFDPLRLGDGPLLMRIFGPQAPNTAQMLAMANGTSTAAAITTPQLTYLAFGPLQLTCVER